MSRATSVPSLCRSRMLSGACGASADCAQWGGLLEWAAMASVDPELGCSTSYSAVGIYVYAQICSRDTGSAKHMYRTL